MTKIFKCERCGNNFDADAEEWNDVGLEELMCSSLDHENHAYCMECTLSTLDNYKCGLCGKVLEISCWWPVGAYFDGFTLEKGDNKGKYTEVWVCPTCDDKEELSKDYEEATRQQELEDEIKRYRSGDMNVSEEAMWEGEAERKGS